MSDGISEAELLVIVRELDVSMTDDEIRNAYRAGMFEQLLPEIEEYAKQQSIASISNVLAVTEAELLEIGGIECSDTPDSVLNDVENIEVHEMPIPDDIDTRCLPSIEYYHISADESLINLRADLRASGKWDEGLEIRWWIFSDGKARIAKIYNDERELFTKEPRSHPDYEEEWLKFRDRRCAELVAEGMDPDTYDFQREWSPFWLKRMQEIMHAKVEEQIAEFKRSLQIDEYSLRQISNSSNRNLAEEDI